MKLIYSILLLTILTVYPQQLYEHQIIPFDGEDEDMFGYSVVLSDSFIFIGSYGDDNYSGSVYVYRRNENDWIFWKKIFASDKRDHSFFGSKLITINNKLFVGSINSRVNNIPTGAVYYFVYEKGDWVEKQKIVPLVLNGAIGFGISIASYESHLLIGAFDDQYIYNYAGKAFLFEENNGSFHLKQELVPSDPQYLGRFGYSVIMDSNLILIGSVQDSTVSGDFSGSVYSFIKKDTIWIEKTKYLPDSNSANLGYGGSVSINNNFVFIGAHGDIGYTGPGSVYIYEKDYSNLKFLQKINSAEGYNYDKFGYPVVSKEDSLLVGASFDTTSGINTGSTYLFILEDGEWRKKIKFTPSDKENALYFGKAIDFKKNNFLIGAPVTLQRTGKVYLYNDIPVNVNDDFNNTPEYFKLHQNYPNPFNPTTSISFSIQTKGKVLLKVFDILGNEIATLADGEYETGTYDIDFNAYQLSSGIYFYTLITNEFRKTNKMILAK